MQNYLYCSWVYSVSHAGAPCTISQYTDHIHGICPMLSGSSPFLLATVMCVLAVTAGSSHTGTRWEAGTGRSQWKGCKKLRLAHSPNKWIFLEKNPLVSVQVFPLGCISWPLSVLLLQPVRAQWGKWSLWWLEHSSRWEPCATTVWSWQGMRTVQLAATWATCGACPVWAPSRELLLALPAPPPSMVAAVFLPLPALLSCCRSWQGEPLSLPDSRLVI